MWKGLAFGFALLLAGLGALSAQSVLPGFPPGVFQSRAAIDGASVVPFGLSFIGTNSNTGTASSYTFTAQGIGSADATRQIAVVAAARLNATFDIVSISIQGISATKTVGALDAGNANLSVYVASVPTGTTGDIIVTYNNSTLRCAISVYRIVGTTAIVSTQGTQVGGVPLTVATKTFTANSGGGVIAGWISGATAANSSTAGNLTEDVDAEIGSTSLFTTGSDTSHSGSSTAYSFTAALSQVGYSAAAWVSIAP